ncbi:aminofutalosine synthase MqnE [Streptomyces sp. TS71-3]|uniref:radical SAM protein n=1 Tax=Streptomyces sp. TS71-3 TaxID=2733862 RepID=UPI001BB33953|nr:aminofutalosine synthase MqnE [Streptomyces sp. TS71-3]
MDAGLRRELDEKVRGGERLSREDGLALYGSDDLAWLGDLAHEARTRRHGDAGYFSVSRGLVLADGSGVEEAVRHAAALGADGVTELRVGIGQGLDRDACTSALRALREAAPGIALRACTAADVHRFETATGLSADEILAELVDAGLESFTADAGPGEDGWEDWSRIHRLAHAKGLKTPAALLLDRDRDLPHRVDDLLRLRELQDETGGFPVFAPLGGALTGLEILKTFAVSRLLLDNVPHLAACWATHGERAALLALQHGADEVDASFVNAQESSDAPAEPTRDDLLDLVRDAGFRPVERDARYEVVREHEGADPGRRDAPQPMRV